MPLIYPQERKYTFLIFLLCVLTIPAIYIFTYNTGYGYDPLEYLVIGRGLTEGVPFYAYAPSKSPGIYYFIAGLMSFGVDFQHSSLATVITALDVVVALVAYFVFKRWAGAKTAFFLSVLVLISTQFTELNMLQPTVFVAICGLASWYYLNVFLSERKFFPLALAGLFIGIGSLFKSVSFFYAVAGVCVIFIYRLRDIRTDFLNRFGALALFSICVVVPMAVIGGWYAWCGKFSYFFEYTIVFPLFLYPSTTTYIAKLYTKLLWIHIFVVGGFFFLLKKETRTLFSQDHSVWSAAVYGICSYIALFKTQSSHYAFPGIPFLMYAALRLYPVPNGMIQRKKGLLFGLAVGGFALMVVSGLLYRPDAVLRFVKMRDFRTEERAQKQLIERLVAPDQYILMTSPWVTTSSYWIAHRYPPPPYISMDVKTIWVLRHRPELFLKMLDNPKLRVVEFNDSQMVRPELEDVFGNLPGDKLAMKKLHDEIASRFAPMMKDAAGNTYWVRPQLHKI